MTETTTQTILVGKTTQELETFAESLGEPRYRGRQLAHWITAKVCLPLTP